MRPESRAISSLKKTPASGDIREHLCSAKRRLLAGNLSDVSSISLLCTSVHILTNTLKYVYFCTHFFSKVIKRLHLNSPAKAAKAGRLQSLGPSGSTSELNRELLQRQTARNAAASFRRAADAPGRCCMPARRQAASRFWFTADQRVGVHMKGFAFSPDPGSQKEPTPHQHTGGQNFAPLAQLTCRPSAWLLSCAASPVSTAHTLLFSPNTR